MPYLSVCVCINVLPCFHFYDCKVRQSVVAAALWKIVLSIRKCGLLDTSLAIAIDYTFHLCSFLEIILLFVLCQCTCVHVPTKCYVIFFFKNVFL